MKKGIVCALALPLAAGALSAIGATSKNVSEVKAEVGEMPAYVEKTVSISAARTRMPTANAPTRVGVEFQALGTDWTGSYLAVVDAGYPKLATTFNMKDYIQIDGQAYEFWNNQDFRAIVQDGWMEPAFKIADMASKSGMVVTLKKGLKLPSRQYINNLNAGLAATPDKSSWETPAEVYTLDATYTITFKAVDNYAAELAKPGGTPMTVEKIEVDHTEIAKQGDRYWLQSVNPTNASVNRFSLNLCVDANTTNDFPSDVVVNGNYYTNGDGKAITSMAEAPSGLTKEFMLQRALSLNLLNGNLILDGEPVTYVYATDGARNSSGYGQVSFFDTTKGRIVMNKNSDGRVKITVDVIVPNFATGTHRLMIKKGTEFPSWSFIMGTPLGATPSNGVYKIQKDLVWDLTFTSAGACTIVPIAVHDNLPTPEKVDSFGLVDRLKFDVNGGDAFRIYFNPISEYTRCIEGDDPHGYYTKRNTDQNIHYGEASEHAKNGNANQLHIWDHILINGQPAPSYYRDSRLHINGVSSSNVGFQDGKVYGSFWFEISEAKAISGTEDDTLSIKFLKGMQLPTQETANGTDKATYVELDQDTEFILTHKQGEAKTAWTIKDVIRSNGEFNTEATAVKSMRLTAGDEGDARALFDLTNYDYEGGFNQFNCGSLILGGEYNVIDNLLINDGQDTTPSIKASTLGYAHNRYFRVPVNKGAVGYNMGTSPTAPSFNQVTIKAGTRFPAYSYLGNGAEKPDVNCTPSKANEKFYVTESDVTLFHVGNGVFKTIADVRTDAVAELTKAYSRDAYRESEKATYDAEVAKINAATSKVTADAALEAAKGVIGALKTDAQYVAEELAAALAAAQTEAKAELEGYKSAELYRETEQALLATAVSEGKAAIEASETVADVATALGNAKATIDALKTKAEYEAEAALAAAKTAAKAELEGYKSAELYREAEQALLATAVSEGKAAIEASETVADVATALDSAKATIDALKTKAEYEAEEAAALAEAKTAAKAELEGYKSAELYREAEQALLATAVSEGKTAIEASKTVADVATALANAKATIDALKTKAEYEAEEAAALAAKTAAIAELEGYKSAELYREAEQALLATAVSEGKAAIEASKTVADVATALGNAKATIDALKTKAEYEAEEAALTAAQTAARAELETLKAGLDMSKYTEENKAVIEQAITTGKSAIDAATSIEAVNEAKAAAVAAINAVPQITPQPEPQPAKKGCTGSVVAASGIVTLVTLLGAGLICAKRKED